MGKFVDGCTNEFLLDLSVYVLAVHFVPLYDLFLICHFFTTRVLCSECQTRLQFPMQ